MDVIKGKHWVSKPVALLSCSHKNEEKGKMREVNYCYFYLLYCYLRLMKVALKKKAAEKKRIRLHKVVNSDK